MEIGSIMAADLVGQLTAILREANVVPRFRPDSIIPSSIYDPVLRAALVGLTIRICGDQRGDSWLLVDAKLKLFQFVAVRLELLPSLRGWVNAHQQGQRPSLDGWARFPHGYAADGLHERLIVYLVASGELQWEKKYLKMSDKSRLLGPMLAKIESEALFVSESTALAEMADMKITLKMLGA